MTKRYFVSRIVRNHSDDEKTEVESSDKYNVTSVSGKGHCIKPAVNTIIGVANAGHIYADSENLSDENGFMAIDVFRNLEDAVKFAYKDSNFRCVTLRPTLDANEKAYISKYINDNPDIISGPDNEPVNKQHGRRDDYKAMSEIIAIGNVNGLDIDYTKSSYYKGYSELRDVFSEERYSRLDEFFKGQAYLQHHHSVRFDDERIDNICKLKNPDEIDEAVDSLYKETYDIYNAKYVSIHDISIQSVEPVEFFDNYKAKVYYDGKTYNIDLDKNGSHLRQAADEILNVITGDDVPKFTSADFQMPIFHGGTYDDKANLYPYIDEYGMLPDLPDDVPEKLASDSDEFN